MNIEFSETDNDALIRFVFESVGVRGELVYLGSAWQAAQEGREYPAIVARQLGQGMAAAVLLSATIKLEGSLILQAQGDGPLHTLVAQATRDRALRGLAHWRGEVPAGDLRAVFGKGKLVMTAEATGRERYQGIVPLEGHDLSAALEIYFERSEQLPTRLWLAADEARAAGMLIQRLPTASGADEDWTRICALAATLTEAELLNLSHDTLLRRLFHEEQVRLFESEPLVFRCGCSRERIEDALRAMGSEEVEAILAEQGAVQVDCEFCNRRYRFDAVDFAALFHGPVAEIRPLVH